MESQGLVLPEHLLWVVAVIAMVLQGLKKFSWLDEWKDFVPLFSVVLGCLGAAVMGTGYPELFQVGVVIGLMASGSYDTFKAFVKPPARTAAGAVLPVLLAGLLLSGCTGLEARQRLLLPAMQPLWQSLQAEAPVEADVAGPLTAALDVGDKEGIEYYWQQAKPQVESSIARRMEAGEISPAFAATLRRQAAELDADVRVFVRR